MEEPEPPTITLDEHDTAAVEAIIMRAVRAGDLISKDTEIAEAANARLAENNAILNKAINALALFGFEKPDEGNIWQQVWNVIGPAAYQRAIAIARGTDPGGLLEQMGGDESPQSAPERELGATPAHRPVPVRDAILRYLRSVGDAGANVAEIKRHLVDAYGMSVHQKTPGMTLYRLLKEGLAWRDGRTWYAAEETDEKNTGADLI